MVKTAQQIVDKTIEIALIIYASRGYQEKPGFKFYKSKHPHELQTWEAACQIYELMTDTDPDDCLIELGEYE